MARKRPRTVPPLADLPAIFTVRAEDRIETNKVERDAWHLFLKWCSQVPDGTKVELLKHTKVVAWLMSAGTPRGLGCRVVHDAPPAVLA